MELIKHLTCAAKSYKATTNCGLGASLGFGFSGGGGGGAFFVAAADAAALPGPFEGVYGGGGAAWEAVKGGGGGFLKPLGGGDLLDASDDVDEVARDTPGPAAARLDCTNLAILHLKKT